MGSEQLMYDCGHKSGTVLWMTFRQKLNKQNKLNLYNNKIKVLNRKKKTGVQAN